MEKEKEINAYSLVTPEIDALADGVRVADRIDPPLFCANGQKGDMFFRVLVPF